MFAPQSQFSEQQDDTLQMSTKLRKMVRFDLNGSFRMVSRVSFFCMVHHFRRVSWERHGGKFMLSPRLSSSELQRFCSCLVTVHVTLHMKLMGRGGGGHVNVRWNLYMMLWLRDDPSLELVHDVAATRPAIRAYASSMAFFFVKSITRKVSSAKNTGSAKEVWCPVTLVASTIGGR